MGDVDSSRAELWNRPLGAHTAMQFAAIAAYLGTMVLSVALFDADAENNWLAFAIWAIASLVLGWALARWKMALLPLLALPIALPFGHANRWLGSDRVASLCRCKFARGSGSRGSVYAAVTSSGIGWSGS
jgi:hypothetical protein